MTLKTRRAFISKSLAGVAGIASIPAVLNSCCDNKNKPEAAVPGFMKKNLRILFQGDSITDAGRDRTIPEPNNSRAMGQGYSFLAAADLLERYPSYNLSIYNRGISGNKVFQLAERWDTDCLEIEPDLLSILIGVNDYWHTLSGKYEGTIEDYTNDFRNLLKNTKARFPDVKLVIGEPFIVVEGSAVDESWLVEFPKYQEASKSVAAEFDAIFIPYQKIFNEAGTRVENPAYWAPDGVHPSIGGGRLMASAWLRYVFGI